MPEELASRAGTIIYCSVDSPIVVVLGPIAMRSTAFVLAALLLAAAAPAARAAPLPPSGEFPFNGAIRAAPPTAYSRSLRLETRRTARAAIHAAPPTSPLPPPSTRPPLPPGSPAFAQGLFVDQDGDTIMVNALRNSCAGGTAQPAPLEPRPERRA